MGAITITSLQAIVPELYLGSMAILLLMVAVYKSKAIGNDILSCAFIAFVLTALFFCQNLGGNYTSYFNGMFATDSFIVLAKLLITISAALVLLVSSSWLKEEGGKPSEFLVLMMLSTLGMLLMVSANDLLTLYMALEMSSLALYVLAAFNRDNAKSSEAGLKYFVLGSLASGMMLFGMSLVYGFAGTTSFAALSTLFGNAAPISMGVVVGLVLIMVGFCFKLSAVPFHMWTPDVYEGAPTPVTAFFATAPKIAALALFTRLLIYPFGHLFAQWQQVVIFASVGSLFVGALGAIAQTSIKRLLAYSSIGHVGFMLMGLASGNAAGVQAMLIYLALYIFMSVGAFGCVLLMRRNGEYVEKISDLAGLSQTRPLLAATLALMLFSMTGIPPLAGFAGKMYVIIATLEAGLAWLAVAGVIAGVIGGYYYLKVVKVMYFDAPAEPLDTKTPRSIKLALALCTVVTLFFFIAPTPLVASAKLAAQALLNGN
ncbi:MAG: NADH-quinone oxidoreductase subunit NuoN [Alphaproteobacteria bacterium]|nr:NADH-quinone oxidoreductase subunit NuoN [Alphaproteobacteria bacterium]